MLSPATLPNKPYLLSLFLIVLSWTLTFNMLTEVCRVWDVALFFCILSGHCTVWAWGELALTSIFGKTGNWLKCSLLVNNHSLCRMMNLKLFGNDLITLPSLSLSNNCFWCLSSVPSVWGGQTCWWSVSEVHLISCTWLLPTEAIRLYLIFHLFFLLNQ